MDNKLTREQIRTIIGDDRFEMSGYDDYYEGRNKNHGQKGSCVLHNQSILNKFAAWGIYEYTDYLYLDFYKGNPRVYYQYFYRDDQFNPEPRILEDLEGFTTTQIIQAILDVTIYSNRVTRRVKS